MSYGLGVRFTVEGDPAAPARVAAAIAPERIRPVIGRAASNVFVAHYRMLNRTRPNKLGGKRTNYFLGAARGTSYEVVPDGVLISTNQIGIRQRYYGGTIRPKKAKYLTIPVHPMAHGKRAGEFGKLDLIRGRGGKPIALALPAQGKRGFGTILYRLVQQVNQKPDPSILPTAEQLGAGITPAVDSTVQRAWRRGGGADAAGENLKR